MKKTQRIGRGDYSEDFVLQGKDELAELEGSINEMCRQIVMAQDAVVKEAEGRIAAIEQLRHAERLSTVGRLASGMAHELGTPLNIVGGRAKMIMTEDLQREEVVDYARIIMGQADRMAKIIQDLLDFARRRKIHKSLVNIRKIIDEACKIINIAAQKSKVTLVSNIADNVVPVMVDEFQMQQVLVNIVMNAIHAMPEGGRIEIEAQMVPSKKCLAIAIQDQGKGIAPEDLKHVFEPFYTTKDVGKGTGLGLSISYGIVQEHGGWIEVSSEIGRGTCFTIYLSEEQ